MSLVAISGNDRMLSYKIDPERWDSWKGAKDRPRFQCADPLCRWEMMPKRSPLGTPFFAHHPGATCATVAEFGGESSEHMDLKMRIAQSVERTSWIADVEVAGTDPRTGNSYRIDVLATPPQVQRTLEERAERRSIVKPWAYEAQLSNQSGGRAQERTMNIEGGHHCNVSWVVPEQRLPKWALEVPSVALVDEKVTDGAPKGMSLDRLISAFHRGSLTWIAGRGYVNTVGASQQFDHRMPIEINLSDPGDRCNSPRGAKCAHCGRIARLIPPYWNRDKGYCTQCCITITDQFKASGAWPLDPQKVSL